MPGKVLTIVNGVITENGDLVSTSAGASNSGDIPILGATGKLDASFMPTATVPTLFTLGSDQSTTNTAATSVTGFSFTISATGTYYFEIWTQFTAATTGTGVRYGLNGPTSSTIQYSYQVWTGANTVAFAQANAWNTTPVGASTSLGATACAGYVRGFFTCTATGTLQLLQSSSSGLTVTTKAGSFGRLYRVS